MKCNPYSTHRFYHPSPSYFHPQLYKDRVHIVNESKVLNLVSSSFPVTIQRHRNPQTVIHRRTCHSPMTEPQMIDVEVDELLAVDVLQPHGHVAQHALQLAFAEFLPANSV